MIATKLRRIAKVNIKSILRKAAYGYKAESSSYIEHLRSITHDYSWAVLKNCRGGPWS